MADPRAYPVGSQICSADDIETAPATTKLVEVWTPNTNTHKFVTLANLATQIGATTSSTAELNFNDGSVAGTAVASKTLVLGPDKDVDTLAVAALFLGAGAGTAVEATATEINKLHDVTAGTTAASKALVVDATKNLDTLSLTELKLGAAGGTAVTATAAEINKVAGVTGGTVTASKALVVDANKDLTSLRNLTAVKLILSGLATSDPAVTGELWNSSGDLKISLGV